LEEEVRNIKTEAQVWTIVNKERRKKNASSGEHRYREVGESFLSITTGMQGG